MAWQRKVLRINLTQGEIIHEPLNMEWANDYMGSRGLGSKYLSEMMDPSVDALGPDNVLIFATGPLTGTMSSTSGRYSVLCKGPLTGAIACSNSGGKFGAELKNAGYDLLILEGKSPSPVSLSIVNETVSLVAADDLWGSTVWHTEETLKERSGDPQTKVASIGVPGEQGVRYACIVNDLHRAAGRSGVGAVMGSKNLKAITVRGSVGVKADNPERFMAVVKDTMKKLADDRGRQGMTKHGTNAMIDTMHAFGGLPTRNFQEVQFEGSEKINPTAMSTANENGHTNLITNKACFGCSIGCGRVAHVDPKHFSVADKPQYWHASGGLEYETAFALGPVVGVDDIDACTYVGFLTNEHSIDPISFGVTVAAAMEMFELGAITLEDTGGIDMRFGNAEALVKAAELTGAQQGFGVDLGLGSKLLCEKYGHPELFMGVKGQEFAGYDSRALQGMGLGYATSNRGACHLKHDVFGQDMKDQSGNGKAQPCKGSQDEIAAIDSTGLCIFTAGAWGMEDYAAQVDAACEGDWPTERLVELGERTWNLERQFNLRAGLTAADDTLPKRLLETPAPSGTAKGKVCELEMMLKEYYQLRGWGADGVPTEDTLDRLGLSA